MTRAFPWQPVSSGTCHTAVTGTVVGGGGGVAKGAGSNRIASWSEGDDVWYYATALAGCKGDDTFGAMIYDTHCAIK